MKKRLLLVRHAQSRANSEGVIQGWLDSPLSSLGHHQAKMLGRRLAVEFEATKIFTSPLSRAAETASHLAEMLDLSIICDGLLKERNLGPLTGLTKQEVKSKFPEVERAWERNLPRPPLTGAEPDDEFCRRAQRAIDAILLKTAPESTAIVVSHGGTLNQMLKNWLQLTPGGRVKFSFDNTSLTIVEVHETFVRLALLNDTSHLGVTHAQRPAPYPQSRNPG